VGSVEVITFPDRSLTTHNDVDGHETASGTALELRAVSTRTALHAAAPPVGSDEVSTLPALSTATHNDLDGHDTLVRAAEPLSTCATVHALDPPVGLAEVRTFPARSTATHSETDGHETPVREGWSTNPSAGPFGSTGATVHAEAPPVGSVAVTTLPQ
jgi:hypothetical protein